jgi:hypothetical protein
MSLALEHEIRRRIGLAERWGGADDDQLLARCRELLIAADALEGAASAPSRPSLNPNVVGCLAETLGSLATAVLLISQTSADDRPSGQDSRPDPADGRPDPNRLLFAVSQNLRFASEAAELCRATLAETEPAVP